MCRHIQWSPRTLILEVDMCTCQRLYELEVKNAWLSVEGVSTMSSLTTLTLEFVRIDDEDLAKLNECCPFLENLNLIGVGGLNEPTIHLQHLKRCWWIVSNVPLSLTIMAPRLIKLKLQCVTPRSLLLGTPMLSDFHLTLDKAGRISIGALPFLKNLRLKLGYIHNFIIAFPCAEAVNELTLDTLDETEKAKGCYCNIDILFDVFPNMSSLNLGPGAYSEVEAAFGYGEFAGRVVMEGLKSLTAYLVIRDNNVTLSFISLILSKCRNLSAVSLLIHRELNSTIANNVITRCMAMCSTVQWKWGIWKEGCKDDWLSDGH
uniref:F-box/LRR-repeat protein 15/At3g58940/PEG3-like LRR domain-containing protein n=1 Tax=Opuntia streptacantha TaxID=393608 RepID=A0A7C8ZNJ6_OPUST